MNEAQDISTVWEELAQPGGRIVYLVLDGAAGLRDKNTNRSAVPSLAPARGKILAKGLSREAAFVRRWAGPNLARQGDRP